MSESRTFKVSNVSLTNHIINSIRIILAYKMYLFKKVKNLIQLLLGMALLVTNVSFAEIVYPSNLADKKGISSSQPLEVLAVQDQQASDDNSNKYISFDTGPSGYIGRFRFNVPASPNTTIQKLTFHTNYRGPEKSFQKWEFQFLNVQTGKWVSIADNGNVANWFWSDITATITNPSQFINSQNQINSRYITNNDTDNSQLDYVSLEITRSGTQPPPVPDVVVIPPSTGSHWQPAPGLKWHIQYTGTLNTSLNVDAYNIDLFDTSAATISALKSRGKHVICYFSAGSYENWRPDTSKFPASVLGQNLDGWPGEKWLDVRKLDVLIPIMRARMQMAATKGCHAVDPDNVDGYSNKTGFPLSYNDQLAYNIALTEAAHDLGLAIGLKNNLDQIKDLVNHYDFAVNEECFQYGECDALKPFANAGKPVFGIEYNLSSSSFCPKSNSMNFDFQKKKLSLDAWVETCR